MLRNFFAILSLQAFAVSNRRKGLFLLSIVAFGVALYAYRHHVFAAYIPVHLLELLLVLLGSAVLVGLLRLFAISAYRQRSKIPVGEHDNFILGIDALSLIAVAFIVLGSIFPIFSIPFTQFITSISVFSVAIAWLFKEYITNFIDSFRLMFSKDFLVGDYIKVGENSKGIITDITFRATKVKTDEGDVMFIPNSSLMNSEVVNYSKVRFKRIIVPFLVANTAILDPTLLEQTITDALQTVFPELIQLEKTFLRILSVEGEWSRCAYELAIDEYSFATEDRLHRIVYETVLSFRYDGRST